MCCDALASGGAPGSVAPASARARACRLVSAHHAAATKAGDAYHDPQVRAKGQLLMTRASESAKGVVDEFVVGYAEGKAAEIRRAVEEEREREAEAAQRAARAAEPPPTPASPRSAGDG